MGALSSFNVSESRVIPIEGENTIGRQRPWGEDVR